MLNTLDGFSTQPRITVPFTGAIDVASVNSDSVYLVNLGDTLTYAGTSEKIGINQILWDPTTNTLVFQPDALLNEHSRYAVPYMGRNQIGGYATCFLSAETRVSIQNCRLENYACQYRIFQRLEKR